MELNIENSSTNLQKFTICSNSKCNKLFIIEEKEKYSDNDFLCPQCAEKIFTHHIVQCSNCHSIVDFFDMGEGEEPVVFYVRKCTHCTGNEEDEKHLQIFYSPDAMI